MNKDKKIKIISIIVSIVITLLVVVLFFLDTSLDWGFVKIISCIIGSIWVFFLTPTLLYISIKLKNSNIEHSVMFGMRVGANCLWEILVTPYFGIKFYLANLSELKYYD